MRPGVCPAAEDGDYHEPSGLASGRGGAAVAGAAVPAGAAAAAAGPMGDEQASGSAQGGAKAVQARGSKTGSQQTGKPSCPNCGAACQPATRKCPSCKADVRALNDSIAAAGVQLLDASKVRHNLHEFCKKVSRQANMHLVVLEFHPSCPSKKIQLNGEHCRHSAGCSLPFNCQLATGLSHAQLTGRWRRRGATRRLPRGGRSSLRVPSS
jgi:hypothetical protein